MWISLAPLPEFIDPDELPFTTEEVFQAASRFLPMETARMLADHPTDCAPGMIEHRALRRTEWRAAGIPHADAMPLHGGLTSSTIWC